MAWVKVHDQGIDPARPSVPGVVVLSEEADNDSDKTLAIGTDVGSGFVCKVLGVRVEYTASGDAGNRQVTLRLLDSAGDVLSEAKAAATLAATNSAMIEFTPLVTAATPDSLVIDTMPDWWLDDQMSLRILDSAAISAAADEMHVHVRLLKYPGK